MRKFRISLLTLALAACAFGAQAAGPEIETLAGRARDLFDYGRWSDARQEFLRVRAALTPSDRLLAQEADFYLAACAVELGSPDAEGALREFAERYPESVYANDVRFALGSFYCAAGNMEKGPRGFRADRLQGVERAAPRAVRHPHGLRRVRRGRLPEGVRLFRPHRQPQRIRRSRPLLQGLYRLCRRALRPCEAGLHGASAQRRLPRRGSLLPHADRVPRGQLPLCGRKRRDAGPPGRSRAARRAGARGRRIVVPAGGFQQDAGAPRGFPEGRRGDGPRRQLPGGLLALPHGPLCGGRGVAAQGVRRRRRADAERLLPPGRLLPARRGQGVGDAGFRDGFRRVARRDGGRGRAVQLRQIAVRTGRRRLQRRDQRADALCRTLSFVAARGGRPVRC